MISSKVKQNFSIPKEIDYYKAEGGNEFPIKPFITKYYGYAPCFYTLDNVFSSKILDFLFENGKLIQFYSSGKLENHIEGDVEKSNGGFYIFKYKDVFIKVTVKTFSSGLFDEDPEFIITDSRSNDKSKNKKTFNISITGPANIKDFCLNEFTPFILNENQDVRVHLFIKNQYGDYNFEPIAINLPENLDLELNYGKNFLEIDKKIKERLQEKPNGLFMFHGLPGTGKTT